MEVLKVYGRDFLYKSNLEFLFVKNEIFVFKFRYIIVVQRNKLYFFVLGRNCGMDDFIGD